jgi:lysophospholipase L1-like esterase
VNGGQNSITSHTVLHEKLIPFMNMIRPDYILILIGTNDIQALCRPQLIGSWIRHVNRIPENPTLQKLEQNLRQMINIILGDNNDDNNNKYSSNISPHVQLAICTLPPLGENLNSYSNQMIRQANGIIERLVTEKSSTCPRISLIPLYHELECVILQKKWKYSIPYDIWWLVATVMYPLYHIPHGTILSWNTLSYLMGNHSVLSDGVHLNENGRNVLVQLIVNEFLYKKNITKAIAVKKFR